MNERISEIFDYGDEIVMPGGRENVVDPVRIRERTMEKIRGEKGTEFNNEPYRLKPDSWENNQAGADAPDKPSRRKRPLRWAVSVLAAVLCVVLAIPVLAAAGVEPVYEALYAVAPAIAQNMKPVNLSCEDNGIEMEVLSAYIHGGSAEIYITIKDLSGDRVDGTTDLFDSYSINTPFDCMATCEFVEYDEEEKTAKFLVSITQFGEKKIEGEKLTFSARCFLSHKRLSEGVLLEPENIPFSPVQGVQLTKYGCSDGWLRIQMHYDDIIRFDNHGFVYLMNETGDRIEADQSEISWDEAQTGHYYEYGFKIPEEELPHYLAYGDFTTCETLTEGNWQVTFPLENTEPGT